MTPGFAEAALLEMAHEEEEGEVKMGSGGA